MADIAIFRINYKSDFVLTLNSDAGWMTPFCIKFWTGAPSQAYFASYDGTNYTHCTPVGGEPNKLLVQFDDHHLPIGDLKFQIGYHFTVADFPTSVEDEVLNQASVIIEVDDAPAQVMLDLNGETAPEIEFSLPAYANEAQRIANEEQRIAHEAIRIVNEESRIAAETVRQQNEEQRISQETARVEEFDQMKQESETATADANAAATLANEKAALAADKAALAQASATLANEEAQLAADKAALAQAAATLANDKAALAQQKADYAQTQGDYAKAQGDYAKQQGEIAEEDHERADADHTRAESDHATAGSDHTQAGTDHTRAESDHATASADHTQAGQDHTRAESDHAQATSDHTQAGTDHTRAESDHTTASADHTQAGQDHTRAESDHTRAESDHAAVEVYVDSLGAFDISAYHATGGVLAKYADLTAALGTNGANIPDALRKGGMSVKFVLSSDNKYVEYFLTKNTWSASEADWEKVNLEEEVSQLGQNIVRETSGKTIGEILTLGADSVPETDITSVATKKGGYGYDSNLNLYVRVPTYDAYELDVTGLALFVVSFYAYGYCGILMEDGSLYEVKNCTDYRNKQTIVIPDRAKYLRITMANTLGTEIITKQRPELSDYSSINEAIKENKQKIEENEESVSFAGDVITGTSDAIVLTDITNTASKMEGYGYNSDLQLYVRVPAYDAYELDVTTLALCNVSFYAYGGYYGFVMDDGTLFGVFESTSYSERMKSMVVPFGAKYLRISWANTLGTQKITKERISMRDYNTLNENINELNTLLPTDIDGFNNVKLNRDGVSLFRGLYQNVAVDKTNRLVVSFNGDSIIGSQLDNITKSAEYDTGDFPPNMSKMIMARQFLDDYQFDNADVVYRNIIHSDWVKSSGAFEISNGKDEPSKTFNEIEVYGTTNVGDSAEITVTDYTYFKLIWSEYANTSKFQVLCSINGGAYVPWSNTSILPEYIEVNGNSRCMQKYAVLTLNPTNTYTFKIIATENPNNILFWGCEMWNNPRLDVVVEAFSGSRAISQVRTGQLEAYHSDWHTPALVVSDILSINDYSFIVDSDETIDQWMTSNKALYNRVIDNGIALLLFTPWQSTNYLTKNAVNVAIQNNLPYIDIQKKQTVLPPSSAIYGPDGTHLSDYGNTYFYDELKRVLNDE